VCFRNDLEHPIFAEAPIFVAQILSRVPKVDSAEIRVRVAGRRFTIGGSPVCRRMVGFARLVGEGQLTDAAAAGQTERRLRVDSCQFLAAKRTTPFGALQPVADHAANG